MCTLFEATGKSHVLQHKHMVDAAPSNITDNWQLWCRLCAKEDPQGISLAGDTFVESSKTDKEASVLHSSLESSIEEYFSVQITCDDKLPKMLCTECISIISSLVNFTERVARVQQMLSTLQKNAENSKPMNINAIRRRYGLLDENLEDEHLRLNHPAPEMDYFKTTMTKDIKAASPKLKKLNTLETNLKLGNKSEQLDDVADNNNDEDGADNNQDGADNTNDDDDDYDNNDENDSDYANSNDDDDRDNLEETLMDVPSLCTKAERRSKCDKNTAPMSDASATYTKKWPKQQEWPCSKCPRVCKRKRDYEVHLLTHLPDNEKNKFPCTYCGKKFITKTRAKQHSRLVHRDDRPFACTKCNKTFKVKRYLKNHMETHNPNKHICAECGLQLSSRATLTAHLLVHSDERNHKCECCGRAFKSAKNLKHHLLVHTGLRLYSCNFCDSTFKNASSCRVHKKNAHPLELAALEATGGGETYTRVPTLEDLKTYARTATNAEFVGSKRNRGRNKLGLFPKSDNSDVNIKPCSDSEVNKNRVRYAFPRE